jgi:hypothetical protein
MVEVYMRSIIALFSLRNRIICISLILIPKHLYSILGKDLSAESHPLDVAHPAFGLFMIALLAATILAIILTLTCWVQVYIQLYRNDTLPFFKRFMWAGFVLCAPYGLILYYHYFHKRPLQKQMSRMS